MRATTRLKHLPPLPAHTDQPYKQLLTPLDPRKVHSSTFDPVRSGQLCNLLRGIFEPKRQAESFNICSTGPCESYSGHRDM